MEIGNLLKKSMENMELSDAAELRILKECAVLAQNKTRKKKFYPGANGLFRKTASAAAAAALCLCLSVTVFAAGQFGYFKDVKNWFGTVTGTTYEQATEEIQVHAAATQEGLTVWVTMLTPQEFPYRELEVLGIESYQIVDKTGKVVREGGATDFYKIIEDRAEITIPLDNLESGEYRLLISAFVGSKKADQPLPIHGAWNCDFSINAG